MKFFVCLLLIAAVAGCSTDAPTTSVSPQIGATTDSARLASDSSPDSTHEVIVIDVRSKEEWDAGHVSQAIHIPHTEIAKRISEVSDHKNAKIVVYCAVGGRAGKAKAMLETLGFTNVENGGGYHDVNERFNE